jgi:two-component system cell cycle sensor histidine kinase/response regulator CckA
MTKSAISIVGVPTILVVEDNELVMELTRNALQDSGYNVVTTYLPCVALNLVKQGNFPVNLLVTDVVMPQMNGPELFRHMRELIPYLPVLYMSGYSDKAIQDVMHEEKAHFLPKPFKITRLLEKVSNILAV